MSSHKPHILLMGQTPPPWHGQAVATQILFNHDWPGLEGHRLRMEYSESEQAVQIFRWRCTSLPGVVLRSLGRGSMTMK